MPARLPGLTGYVLAGGQSRRMGQDKAELVLGGRTMLAWAVRTLSGVCDEVVVLGRQHAETGQRSVADVHPGSGPMSGMEAALGDLPGEWAAFLPVDMPMLPLGLLGMLHAVWAGVGGHARVCFALADGVTQPLISAVHQSMREKVEAAVARGELRVRPALERAAQELGGDGAVVRTEIRLVEDGALGPMVRVGEDGLWRPSEAEWAMRHLWFSNLNTPAELEEARGYAGKLW